jgi:hypothetical protein
MARRWEFTRTGYIGDEPYEIDDLVTEVGETVPKDVAV